MTEIIMYDDVAVTSVQMEVTIWRDSAGVSHANEHAARYARCTHRKCQQCGEPAPKPYTHCKKCRQARRLESYKEFPVKLWNGEDLLYSDTHDEWLVFGLDDIYNIMEDDESATLESLRLLIGRPVFPQEIDPLNLMDEFPEDVDLNPEVEKAIAQYNKTIRAIQKPDYWEYQRVRPDLSAKEFSDFRGGAVSNDSD